MKYNVVLAQDTKELKFILRKFKEKILILPLNLDILVYCNINNIPHVDLNNYLDNSIHKRGLTESEKLIKSLKFKSFCTDVVKHRYKNLIRNYFNSIYFINETLKEIEKKIKIKKIILSGWNSVNINTPRKNYILSEICYHLFKPKTLFIEKKKNESKVNLFSYEVPQIRFKKNLLKENGIILNNFGYNFKRILLLLLLKRKKVIHISFQKIKFVKKIIFKFLGIKLILIKKNHLKIKPKVKNHIELNYSNRKIKYLINSRLKFLK